ncbi:MAG: transcriptional activator RfaH [Pseudomonadota bacterium]
MRESERRHGDLALPQMPHSLHWYIAQLKPGGFERAKTNLHRQGFASFMPLRANSARRNGKIRQFQAALFPGYLFVQVLPDQQNWRAINSTYGISRLVSLSGGHPTKVPEELMSALFARTDNQGLLSAPDDLMPGQTVRIIAGPFAQSIAEISALKPNDRVGLLMELMGRSVRTEVSARHVEIV